MEKNMESERDPTVYGLGVYIPVELTHMGSFFGNIFGILIHHQRDPLWPGLLVLWQACY